MNEFFGSRRLTVNEQQLDQLKDLSISEIARSLLKKANILSNMRMCDTEEAAAQQSVRELARDLFIKLG
jgi:hypothetical protein